MTTADIIRLLAVPAFAWAAWHDVHTRRVPADRRLWYPLVAVGVLALGLDGLAAAGDPFATRLLALQVAVSVGFMTILGYAFWWFGLFGGADRKAFVVLGVLLPTTPVYDLGGVTLPLVRTTLGVLSLSVVTNAALLGLAYPLALAVRNSLAGEVGPAMFLGCSLGWTAIPRAHGKLMESREGIDFGGLDLDALRMYLRWRGITVADVRERPSTLRDPASLPDQPNPPTGGAVGPDDLVGAGGAGIDEIDGGDPKGGVRPNGGGTGPDGAGPDDCSAGADLGGIGANETGTSANGTDPNGGADGNAPDPTSHDDPWGAAAFLDSIDGTAYGTSPESLQEGLEVLASRDEVWVMPGIPFVVPLFLGLVVALTLGDVLFGVLRLLGFV